jgi:hypothetical protein
LRRLFENERRDEAGVPQVCAVFADLGKKKLRVYPHPVGQALLLSSGRDAACGVSLNVKVEMKLRYPRSARFSQTWERKSSALIPHRVLKLYLRIGRRQMFSPPLLSHFILLMR